jgi:DHA1 family tetracycline resistance protein-like MFS transporter
VGHLPKDDWRMGVTFFVCSGLQFLAVILAVVHFRRLKKLST